MVFKKPVLSATGGNIVWVPFGTSQNLVNVFLTNINYNRILGMFYLVDGSQFKDNLSIWNFIHYNNYPMTGIQTIVFSGVINLNIRVCVNRMNIIFFRAHLNN